MKFICPNFRVVRLAACVLSSLCFVSEAKQPNVIFILCDDLGYGDLGAFFQNAGDGGRKPRVEMRATPHLDEFAAEGIQLRGHYTAAPVCAPARASLLLGVTQGHANVRDNQFDKALEDNHTLGSVMKQAGYRTACIGKWGVQGGKAMPAHPMNRGFDEYFGYIEHKAGHFHYPKEDGMKLFEGMKNVVGKYDKCYTTDLFTARAKKFIIDQERDHKDQPFFLYLAYDTPHAKAQIPTGAFPPGGGVKGGLQWLGKSGKMINTAEGKPDNWLYPDHADATWDDPARPGKVQPWPEVAKRYATMVRRIDDCVEDLVQTLKDLGIDDDTLIVFTSDNGPSKESYLKGQDSNRYSRTADPGFFQGYGPFDGIKRDCYEGGVRVGAMVRWPGTVPSGKISERASQFHDWMPTLCELAGIPAPARTDGVSLVPELTGKSERPDSTIYVEYENNAQVPAQPDFLAARRNEKRGQMQLVRSGDLVGVRYDIHSHEDNFQIYNVVKDPGQRHNLAPELKDLQQQMKDRVLQVRRPNESAPRPYMDKLAMPSSKPSGKTISGLEVRVFPIAVPWPVSEHSVPDVSPEEVATPGAVAVAEGKSGMVFQGWISVPEEDDYTFSVPDGCRAVLRLHEAVVLDSDRGKGGGPVRLEAGFHPLTLSVAADAASPKPVLSWKVGGESAEEISATKFVRLKRD